MMKRRWPKEIVFIERGLLGWLDSLTSEKRHRLMKKWVSQEKRRTHKRERREGKTLD